MQNIPSIEVLGIMETSPGITTSLDVHVISHRCIMWQHSVGSPAAAGIRCQIVLAKRSSG